MSKRIVSGIMLILLLVGMLTLAFNIQPVKAIERISIEADGSVDPPDALISTVDNVTYTFTDNIDGYIVVKRSNIIVDGNGYTLQGDGTSRGFSVSSVNNVTIKKTNISSHMYGVMLWESDHNSVTNNNITNSQGWGICLVLSNDNTLNGNTITNGLEDGIFMDFSNYTTVTSNTISHNNGTGISIWSSLDNTISGNSISGNNGMGINIRDSCCNTITNNTMSNNTSSISLDNSFNDLIGDNIISKNQMYGIVVSDSSSTTLSGNNVTNNRDGICLYYSNNNTVSSNHIANNTNGIWMHCSHENNLTGNNITSNTDNGIQLVFSSSNSIYHNNFINNTNQTYIEYSKNTWDDGYPSGGNYWSDYTGKDEYKGPDQNITGTDGIGDDPYVINPNDIDDYPLMPPYPQHDIGIIITVKTLKNVVGQSDNLSISVKILNYGINAETFNITIYANTTIINQMQMTLTNRTSRTVTLNCNTTGFAKGNYTIKAIADTVLGETDTADNTFTGWVIVAMAGDITGPDGWPDGKCEMRDIRKVAKLFGIYYPDPKYNPNCDIVYDLKIDIKDIRVVAKHFGEIDP